MIRNFENTKYYGYMFFIKYDGSFFSSFDEKPGKKSVKSELLGYLITNNTTVENRIVKFSTESEYNINRFSKLLSNLNILDHEIDIQGKIFTISFRKRS